MVYRSSIRDVVKPVSRLRSRDLRCCPLTYVIELFPEYKHVLQKLRGEIEPCELFFYLIWSPFNTGFTVDEY